MPHNVAAAAVITTLPAFCVVIMTPPVVGSPCKLDHAGVGSRPGDINLGRVEPIHDSGDLKGVYSVVRRVHRRKQHGQGALGAVGGRRWFSRAFAGRPASAGGIAQVRVGARVRIAVGGGGRATSCCAAAGASSPPAPASLLVVDSCLPEHATPSSSELSRTKQTNRFRRAQIVMPLRSKGSRTRVLSKQVYTIQALGVQDDSCVVRAASS